MDDFLKQQTQERLNQAQNIAISIAKNADFDAFASGLALFLSLAKTGKNVNILAKPPTVADAQRLYGVDFIGKSNSKKNLIFSIENAIKNVDKVTYFLDADKLKVVIHALPTSAGVSEEDISFERATVRPDMLIVIGYPSIVDLKTDITHEQQINSDDFIISINKDKTVKEFAQINIHETSTYSEIITMFIESFSLSLDEDIAFNLYAALASATKMFSPVHVRPSTFEVAQMLIGSGAGKASFASAGPITKQPVESIVRTFDVEAKIPNPPDQQFASSQTQTPFDQVEIEKQNKDWLKPPKIYRGSKSFDSES